MGDELANMKGLFSDFWDQEDHTKHALFMDTLPENIEDDTTLVALQEISGEALQSAVDKVKHWKEVGNEHFKASHMLGKPRLMAAVDAYSKALEAEELTATQKVELLPSLYVNRAICRYKLGNFVESVADCKGALAIDERNEKAYYHLSRAYVALGLPKEALSALKARPADVDGVSSGLAEMEQAIEEQLRARGAREAAAACARNERERQQGEWLQRVCRARNIVYNTKPLYDVPAVPAACITAQNLIAWPVLLLFEKHGRSEALAEVQEDCTVRDVLDAVFERGLDWDKDHAYRADNVAVSLEAASELHVNDLHTPLYQLANTCGVINRFLVFKLTVL